MLAYNQELVTASGITGLKLKYVSNSGYFIEVTNKDVQAFETIINMDDEKLALHRRQTLKSGQRYGSPYLDALQTKILGAYDELEALELALLQKTKDVVRELSHELHHM